MTKNAAKWFINRCIRFIKALVLVIGMYTMAQSHQDTFIVRPATPPQGEYEKNKIDVWKLDKAHSSVVFSIEYMKTSKIWGRFDDFDVTLLVSAHNKENNFNNGSVDLAINANSISTQNSNRDNHLKSREFLSTDIHPSIDFNGELHQTKKENVYDMSGVFYMNGVEKKIKLKTTHTQTITNINGEIISMFQIKGKINRKHHKIIWNKILDNGGLLMGDTIDFEANIQMVKQPMYN
jgi:polyisoprenoid-binding protein YceI